MWWICNRRVTQFPKERVGDPVQSRHVAIVGEEIDSSADVKPKKDEEIVPEDKETWKRGNKKEKKCSRGGDDSGWRRVTVQIKKLARRLADPATQVFLVDAKKKKTVFPLFVRI